MTEGKRIAIAQGVLSKNDAYARKNRAFLDARGIRAFNLIGSPGSGKTTLLEAFALRLGEKLAVIEGDLQTRRDAERLEKKGILAYQIETGGGCHLDAEQVERALQAMDLRRCQILMIENVGNLVCPAAYDLGEHAKIALLSLPEGDDKILKYPSIFRRVRALVLQKIDLLPYLDVNAARVESEFRLLNPEGSIFRVSAKTGEGVDDLLRFLQTVSP